MPDSGCSDASSPASSVSERSEDSASGTVSMTPVDATVQCAPSTGVSSLAFYRGASVVVFRGDLFVAAKEGRSLLRLRFDRRDPTRVVSTERLLQNRSDTIRLVAGSGD